MIHIHGLIGTYIKKENKVYVNADKTRNLYSIEPEAHDKLLLDNITDKYRKCTLKEVADVNCEAKRIVCDIGLSDRVQVLTEDPALTPLRITSRDSIEN